MEGFALNWINKRKVEECLIIVGAGSLGKMVASIVCDSNQFEEQNVAFVDDNLKAGNKVLDFYVLGRLDNLHEEFREKHNFSLVIAIANNQTRKKIAEQYPDLNYINIIHPTAAISRFANIGIGNIILPNVSVDPEADIHNHVVINKNTTVGHNVTLCDYSQACPGSNLGGYIEEGVFLGLGSIVLPDIRIGKFSTIGAGAVVNRDIPEKCIAVGTPCKPIKYLDELIKLSE